MNVVGIAGWSLVGLISSGCLQLVVQRFVPIPLGAPRLAPPIALEALTAAVFATLAWRLGGEAVLFAYSWLAMIGIALAAIDLRVREMPTKLIWSGGIVLSALFVVAAVVGHDAQSLIHAAIGSLALLAFYGIIYVSRPGQLGGGDLRLGALLGLALGWEGWTILLLGTTFGWLTGAVLVFANRAARRSESGRDLALGPALVFGAICAILLG